MKFTHRTTNNTIYTKLQRIPLEKIVVGLSAKPGQYSIKLSDKYTSSNFHENKFVLLTEYFLHFEYISFMTIKTFKNCFHYELRLPEKKFVDFNFQNE